MTEGGAETGYRRLLESLTLFGSSQKWHSALCRRVRKPRFLPSTPSSTTTLPQNRPNPADITHHCIADPPQITHHPPQDLPSIPSTHSPLKSAPATHPGSQRQHPSSSPATFRLSLSNSLSRTNRTGFNIS